jgi:Flp pilus assembly protein TadB
MHMEPKQFARALMASALVSFFSIAQSAAAQAPEHVVSPSDLQKAAVDSTQARQQNLDSLNRFFSSKQAQDALEQAHMSPVEVKKAVAGLSSAELAQLASKANKAQADFAAGNIDNRDLLIILVCIAALILIIVAVH